MQKQHFIYLFRDGSKNYKTVDSKISVKFESHLMDFLGFMHKYKLKKILINYLRKINNDVKTKYLRKVFINTTDTSFFEVEVV